MSGGAPIRVHLVHGTFDPRRAGQPHWSDADGLLAQGVMAELPPELRARVSFEPFDWSGRNTFAARDDAARALARVIAAPCDGIRLLVGHSHGGTVIADALRVTRDTPVHGVLTLATPFVARMLDVHQGRLGMALYLPLIALWVALGGAVTCALHGAWAAAVFALLCACVVPLGFAGGRLGRWANVFDAGVVFAFPLAFLVAGAFGWQAASTFPAALLASGALVAWAANQSDQWIWPRLQKLRGLPSETDVPPAPDVPLTALRLPGDEASFAIVVAQAMLWFETSNVLGSVIRWVRRMDRASGLRATLVAIALCACGAAVVAYRDPIMQAWLAVLLGVWGTSVAVLLAGLTTVLLLVWLRVLTAGLLALATGPEVLDGMGAVAVYAEPLPWWSSHARCRLEILAWTEDDARHMQALRHSMQRLPFVHRRIARWIRQQAGEDA